ncbi:hypothetical protein SAMN05444157_2807 [Frankineae bacterium MT45]|nr:hypothetical protein SAMN05444157_2807 [Frankineae bacterium MT45]
MAEAAGGETEAAPRTRLAQPSTAARPENSSDAAAAPAPQPGRPEHERDELLREAATMVLYVSVVEIAELAAVPERHLGHGLVTGPVGSQLLLILWGTAVGLALAHWFSFGIAARGFRGDRPTRHDTLVGLVQVAGAVFVAAVSSLPVLLLSDVHAQEVTADVPAVLIGCLSYLLARAAGRGRLAAFFLGLTAAALGVAVALIKIRLAAH